MSIGASDSIEGRCFFLLALRFWLALRCGLLKLYGGTLVPSLAIGVTSRRRQALFILRDWERSRSVE